MTLTINPKFHALIPPLAPEELAQLESNILADGCREPLVCWNGTIVDGHNRYEICQRHKRRFEVLEKEFPDEDSAKVWIITNQFGRRNIAPVVRAELALELEPLIAAKAKENQKAGGGSGISGRQKSDKPTDTKKELAKASGLSHDTIAKVKFIKANAPESTVAEMRKPDGPSINKIYKEVREIKQRQARAANRQQAAQGSSLNENIIAGDFRKRSDAVADSSLDLIFTDPPYNREAEKMFSGLADFAASKLADGGSIVFYCGHLQLPAAFKSFEGKLRHWWTCACVHSGDRALMREYGIRVGWKPMLWFVKRTRDDKTKIVLDTVTGGDSKEFHDWQQDEGEAAHWISALCPKDGMVCDPFLGGATTAAAAQKLGRKWIGFEIDPDTARIASKRLKL